jgi:hypothetical protein
MNSFLSRKYFWNIAMGEVDLLMPYNCVGVQGTRDLHTNKNEKMENVYSIEK